MTMSRTSKRIDVVEVQPSDFEAGAMYALTLLRNRIQDRMAALHEIEESRAGDAGARLMLSGARDLLAQVRSDFEHLLCVGLRAAEESHQQRRGGK